MNIQKLTFPYVGPPAQGDRKLTLAPKEMPPQYTAEEFDISTPKSVDLLAHAAQETYEVQAFTAAEFEEMCGGIPFDFKDLEKKFSTICWDYGDVVKEDTKSYAIFYCTHMLYKIGPDTRKV